MKVWVKCITASFCPIDFIISDRILLKYWHYFYMETVYSLMGFCLVCGLIFSMSINIVTRFLHSSCTAFPCVSFASHVLNENSELYRKKSAHQHSSTWTRRVIGPLLSTSNISPFFVPTKIWPCPNDMARIDGLSSKSRPGISNGKVLEVKSMKLR